MFWYALTTQQRNVLEKLIAKKLINNFYLVGSTALALQLGHRESSELVWFSQDEMDSQKIERSLDKLGELKVSLLKEGTFHGYLDGVQLSFLHYPYPQLRPLLLVPKFNFYLASLEDLGVMKLIAVSQRGARKDFIDLYMLKERGIDPVVLLDFIGEKYPSTSVNYYHVIKSLVYFNDANQEPMPKLFTSLSWEEVKGYFLSQQKELLEAVEGKRVLVAR